MLASAETIDVVADALETHGRPTSVIDPVRAVSKPTVNQQNQSNGFW